MKKTTPIINRIAHVKVTVVEISGGKNEQGEPLAFDVSLTAPRVVSRHGEIKTMLVRKE